MNLSQLNGNENDWKGGYPAKKIIFKKKKKKINCQLENIIIYNIISFFKTLKVGIKTVAILIRGEC